MEDIDKTISFLQGQLIEEQKELIRMLKARILELEIRS